MRKRKKEKQTTIKTETQSDKIKRLVKWRAVETLYTFTRHCRRQQLLMKRNIHLLRLDNHHQLEAVVGFLIRLYTDRQE